MATFDADHWIQWLEGRIWPFAWITPPAEAGSESARKPTFSQGNIVANPVANVCTNFQASNTIHSFRANFGLSGERSRSIVRLSSTAAMLLACDFTESRAQYDNVLYSSQLSLSSLSSLLLLLFLSSTFPSSPRSTPPLERQRAFVAVRLSVCLSVAKSSSEPDFARARRGCQLEDTNCQ